jgi:phage-related protein
MRQGVIQKVVAAMEFRVDFYTTEGGQSPVRDWLQDLKQQIPSLHALTVAGINKLKDRRYHAPPLSEHVEDDLFELRVGRKDIARVLYFFRAGRRIILLHGFIKKSQQMPQQDKELALRRMADYRRRYPDE